MEIITSKELERKQDLIRALDKDPTNAVLLKELDTINEKISIKISEVLNKKKEVLEVIKKDTPSKGDLYQKVALSLIDVLNSFDSKEKKEIFRRLERMSK